MPQPLRIMMAADCEPEPIIDPHGNNLGVFTPGLGYWVTEQNAAVVEKVIADGRATYVDPSSSPFNVQAGDAVVGGSITLGGVGDGAVTDPNGS